MTRRRVLIILICYGVLAWNLTTCRAQNSVAVTPMTVDAKVKRGTGYSQSYTLSNDTGARLRFTCTVLDYWYDEKNQRLITRPGTQPRSASLWVQFSPEEVIVEPHSSATVKALISIPSNSAGGYYTMPVFTALPWEPAAKKAGAETTATAAIGLRFRGLMMLTIQDASEYNVEIVKGDLKPPTESSPLELILDVRNRSTAHAFIHGEFALINSAGQSAGRGKILDKRYLPGQRFDLNVPWAGELSAGHYTAVVTLSYERAGMEPASLVYELPFDVKSSLNLAQNPSPKKE
jgi:hypothetical protein